MRVRRGKNRRLWIAAGVMLTALLLLAALTVYLRWERPPAPAAESETPAPSARATEKPADSDAETIAARRPGAAAEGRRRRSGVYTLLLAGRDGSSGCTDTILLGRLDSEAHTLELVSIPRDTLVNLDWPVRKINAVYAAAENAGGDAAGSLRREIRRLCGFTPDCCAVVDLSVFVEAVDLIGGVDFELPQAMHYDDGAQDLHIHLEAGAQHLSGEQAMGLVRYRSGYPNGDLDRLSVQQRFMEAVLGELTQLESLPRLPELAALLAGRTDTDLTAANVAWLIRQVLLCPRENIRFRTMPNTPATVAGLSYVLAEPEAWLAMINESLDPYAAPIRLEELDLVYRDESGFHATRGELRGAEYYDN